MLVVKSASSSGLIHRGQFDHNFPPRQFVTMEKILGLDFGTASVGWALIEKDKTGGSFLGGGVSSKSKLLDDLVSKLSQAAIKPSTNVNKSQL